VFLGLYKGQTVLLKSDVTTAIENITTLITQHVGKHTAMPAAYSVKNKAHTYTIHINKGNTVICTPLFDLMLFYCSQQTFKFQIPTSFS
jgi:hypothetical protein